MADKLVRNPHDAGVIERYVDMSDGTWALFVQPQAQRSGTLDALVRAPNDSSTVQRFADQGDGTKAAVWQTS